MNNAKRLLDVLFGERITMDLEAGKRIDLCREMKMADDEIVEDILEKMGCGIEMITLGCEKGCESLIEAGKKVVKQDMITIANIAFENILERQYLTNNQK